MANRVDPSAQTILRGLYTDRTSSWLSYNSRLLDEAKDGSLPIYERVKFLAKCAANATEIYRKEGFQRKNEDKIEVATSEVAYQALNEAFTEIVDELADHKIILPLKRQQIPATSFREILSFFQTFESLLQPIILGPGSSLDFDSGQSYLLLKIQHDGSEELYNAYVHVPDTLPRFLEVHQGKQVCFIFIEDIVRLNLKRLFPGYKISESFSVTCYRPMSEKKVRGRLQSKNKSSVFSILEYDQDLPIDMLGAVTDLLGLSKNHLVQTGRYQRLQDLHQLTNPHAPKLAAKAWPAFQIPDGSFPNIFDDLNHRDVLLHLPYHTADYVFRLYREASIDPYVKEIYACIQRATSDSLLINSLITAARNEPPEMARKHKYSSKKN
jgi:polyphosphate kinase